MNILPKSSKEFARKEYWDQFFTNRNKSFEWYGEYSDLKTTLLKYIKVQDNILIVGCGNSSLSANLYDDGYRNNTSIDISEVAIKKMISKYKCNEMRQEMIFEVMDIFNMKYDNDTFNVVLDKGTLDALSSDKLNLNQMFDEIERILKNLGRYICISLLQANVLRSLLSRFGTGSWIIRVHRCNITSNITESDSVNLPVFVVVFTKLKANLPSVSVDIDIIGNNIFHRCQLLDEVYNMIDDAQKFEFVKFHVRSNKIEDDNFFIELFGDQSSTESRYQLYFAQKATVSAARCAVFIVPQGREHEWLFSTAKGRESLLKQCLVDRLAVVHLNRRHNYDSMDQIKAELSAQVSDFFPRDSKKKINFLSIGDDIGERYLLYKGKSDFSGEFIVEDVKVDHNKYRRLVFMNNQNVIQSEAKLKTVKTKKKSIEVIDNQYLSCDHHKIIATYLALLGQIKETKVSLALVGLGGGCFINFLLHNLSKPIHLDITVIEIDSTMLDIAKKWFDFKTDKLANITTNIIIQDGLEFIANVSKTQTKFDFIIFDVDSKNLDLGVSCPPKEFVEESFLKQVQSSLSSMGLFILNLVARNEEAKKHIYQQLSGLFSKCLLTHVESDLNEILVCTKDEHFAWHQLKDAQQRISYLRKSPLYLEILTDTYNSICRNKPNLL